MSIWVILCLTRATCLCTAASRWLCSLNIIITPTCWMINRVKRWEWTPAAVSGLVKWISAKAEGDSWSSMLGNSTLLSRLWKNRASSWKRTLGQEKKEDISELLFRRTYCSCKDVRLGKKMSPTKLWNLFGRSAGQGKFATWQTCCRVPESALLELEVHSTKKLLEEAFIHYIDAFLK